MNTFTRLFVLACLTLASQLVTAQTVVKEAWVRGTVAQQKATGAFMQLTSTQGAKLISVASPAAGAVEIHEMVMDANVMKMRAVASVELPAGKAVDLMPGGYHIMLMDLKQQAKVGDTIALTLVIEGKDGKRESLAVKALVKSLSTSEHKH